MDEVEWTLQRKGRSQTEGLGLWKIEAGDVFVPPNDHMYTRDTSHPDSVAGQSQAGQILRHFQVGGTLTALDALDLFGCNRLAARVADLKNKGYNVKSRFVTLPNGKRVSEYRLVLDK